MSVTHYCSYEEMSNWAGSWRDEGRREHPTLLSRRPTGIQLPAGPTTVDGGPWAPLSCRPRPWAPPWLFPTCSHHSRQLRSTAVFPALGEALSQSRQGIRLYRRASLHPTSPTSPMALGPPVTAAHPSLPRPAPLVGRTGTALPIGLAPFFLFVRTKTRAAASWGPGTSPALPRAPAGSHSLLPIFYF